MQTCKVLQSTLSLKNKWPMGKGGAKKERGDGGEREEGAGSERRGAGRKRERGKKKGEEGRDHFTWLPKVP